MSEAADIEARALAIVDRFKRVATNRHPVDQSPLVAAYLYGAVTVYAVERLADALEAGGQLSGALELVAALLSTDAVRGATRRGTTGDLFAGHETEKQP
jgi:hypothetical protein